MTYRVELQSRAADDLRKLPPDVRLALRERIDALAQDPRPPGTAELAGKLKGLRKLREGDYRAVYSVDEKARVVSVWRIGHRRNIYRRMTRGHFA